MPKLRKMLGSADSQECISLLRLMETQNKTTLAAWAVDFAKNNYLKIYENECPGDTRLTHTVTACEECIKGSRKLTEIKPLLKASVQLAREAADNPTAQAAARAVSTACSALQTPTNALGFLFYGAAASAYSQAGLAAETEVYEHIACEEFKKALQALQQAAVADEPNPVKIKWNC